MKKERSERTQKFLLALPIAGLVLLVLAMAALWAVALSYAIGVYIAWNSAMAFLTLFGLSFIGAGLLPISLHGFLSYMRKVWYDRWPDAPGAKFFVRGEDDDIVPVRAETVTENADAPAGKEKKSSSVIFKPKHFTFQNVGYALLLLAVIFVIASAAMGSLDADKWVDARSDYMTSHGWYAESEPIRGQFSPNEVTAINIDAEDRKIVVRYDADATMVTVACYNLYPDEYNISRFQGDARAGSLRSQRAAHRRACARLPSRCHARPLLPTQPHRGAVGDHHPRLLPRQHRDKLRSARHLRQGLNDGWRGDAAKRHTKSPNRTSGLSFFVSLFLRCSSSVTAFLRPLRGTPCCSTPLRSRRQV